VELDKAGVLPLTDGALLIPDLDTIWLLVPEVAAIGLSGLFNSLYLKCKRTGESKTLHPGEKWRCQRDVGFQGRKISDSLTGNPNQKSRGCRGIRFVSDPSGACMFFGMHAQSSRLAPKARL
jgi:hypothetical protein